MRRANWLLGIWLIFRVSGAWAQVSASGEFSFGPSGATTWAGAPALAPLPGGGFVAVWQQLTVGDPNGWDIYGQRLSFDAAGNLLPSTPFRVNTALAGCQQFPAVAADAAGNFFIAWQSDSQAIKAQYFRADGTAVGGELQVNSSVGDAGHRKQRPAVAMVPAGDGSTTLGNILVLWQSEQPKTPSGSGFGVWGQLFSVALAGGVPQPPAPAGGEFQVNNVTTLGAQHNPAVAWAPVAAGPRFVGIWQSEGNGSWAIATRTFTSAGAPLTSEAQVNTSTGPAGNPAVAADPSGNFFVSWELLRPNGPGAEIMGRRFRAAAGGFDGEIVVPSDLPNPVLYPRTRPAVATDAAGDFLLAWEANGQDGSGLGIFAQGFSPQAAPQGFEFQVNGTSPASSAGDQAAPAVAATPGGTVAVVWQGPNAAGTTSLFGHLYAIGQNFFTLAPCRLVDTRNPTGPFGGPSLASGAVRVFPLLAAGCGIPSTAKALSLNVTVTNPTNGGFVIVYPGDAPTPNVSNINFSGGQTRANNAVVILSRGGDGSLAAKAIVVGPGQVDLILDVNGYFQ